MDIAFYGYGVHELWLCLAQPEAIHSHKQDTEPAQEYFHKTLGVGEANCFFAHASG